MNRVHTTLVIPTSGSPSLEILNTLGQSLLKQNLTSQVNSIALDNVPQGCYYLRVLSSNTLLGTGKLLIMP